MNAQWRLGLLVALGLLAGCAAQVRVVPRTASLPAKYSAPPVTRQAWWQKDPLESTVVRRHKLVTLIRTDPELALLTLHEAVARDAKRDELIATAGLTVRYAGKIERTQPANATSWYLMAAALAYRNLAVEFELSATNALTSPIVQSYNRAALGVVMLLQKFHGGMRTNHVLAVSGESVQIEARAGDAFSDPCYYDQWLAADYWRQIGLQHNYRAEGLGARLVAVRTNRQATEFELRQPDEGIFYPSTAILRFPSGPEKFGFLNRTQTVQLVFYHPKFSPLIEVEGEQWPLAADYTMPGAMLLSRTRLLFETRWTALVNPIESPRPHRLYLFEPYSPDRIPIIMVHGLHSTPLAWQQLTNELLGDPEIRRRYQIWHYLYPTGLPFLTSAADFRDEVGAVRRIVDPAGHDFATQHMIVIAHSMGGLLARTLVTDSGDAMWNSTFAIPVTDLDPNLEGVAELRRMFYFHPQPYVKRVIFIAVPHRGSATADSLVGRIVSGWVTLPKALHQFIANFQKAVPGLLKPEAAPLFKRGYPDGIRVLSPKTPGLVALAKLPVASGTPFHSIMGDRGLGGGTNSSDGVVTYASSHLAGAASETIVPADHGACENPEAIAEVKRILKLHIASLGSWEEIVAAGHKNQSVAKQLP